MQKPPYLRWTAAVLIVLAAAAWDLRPEPTVRHPFLTSDLRAGDPVTDEDVAWLRIPAGLLEPPDLSNPRAAVDLRAGDPLTESVLAGDVTVPEGWWAVPVAVGAHARPGDTVLLVVTDPPATVWGTVLEAQAGDPYSLDFRPASVAVPAEAAPAVAAASLQGSLVAATRPRNAHAEDR